jgi:hypothetical protein
LAKFSLRRFDTQARVGLWLSLLAALLLLAELVIVFNIHKGFEGVDAKEWTIYHGRTRRTAVYAAVGLTLVFAVAGMGFGFNSAGERRNDRQNLSWAAFFIGATVISLAVILFMVFRLRGELAL